MSNRYEELHALCADGSEDEQNRFTSIYTRMAKRLSISDHSCRLWRQLFNDVIGRICGEAPKINIAAAKFSIDKQFDVALEKVSFECKEEWRKLRISCQETDDALLFEVLQQCYSAENILLQDMRKTPLQKMLLDVKSTVDRKFCILDTDDVYSNQQQMDLLSEIRTQMTDFATLLHIEINDYNTIVYKEILGYVQVDVQVLSILTELCFQFNSMMSKLIQRAITFYHEVLRPDVLDLLNSCYDLLLNHIGKTFVIEIQSEKFKTQIYQFSKNEKKKLDVQLRGLGMSVLLESNIISFPEQVKINFFSEENIETKEKPVFPSVHDTAPLLRNGAGDLVADFREVILSSPTRTSRPTKQDKVTDYLYFMSFTVHMRTDYSPVVSIIHVHHRPVIFTSAGGQLTNARGTLIWDCLARKEINTGQREHITWNEFRAFLAQWWHKETTVHLTEEHLLYLKQRLLTDCSANEEVKKSTVLVDIISDKSQTMTFWKWFSACANLVKHPNVVKEYKNGHIVGFIRPDAVDFKLSQHRSFTFMIRFSENELENEESQKTDPLALLVVAVVYCHQGEPIVAHVKKVNLHSVPMTNTKGKTRTQVLSDHLHDGPLSVNLMYMEFDQDGRHRLLQHLYTSDDTVHNYEDLYDMINGTSTSSSGPYIYGHLRILAKLPERCDIVPPPEKKKRHPPVNNTESLRHHPMDQDSVSQLRPAIVHMSLSGPMSTE